MSWVSWLENIVTWSGQIATAATAVYGAVTTVWDLVQQFRERFYGDAKNRTLTLPTTVRETTVATTSTPKPTLFSDTQVQWYISIILVMHALVYVHGLFQSCLFRFVIKQKTVKVKYYKAQFILVALLLLLTIPAVLVNTSDKYRIILIVFLVMDVIYDAVLVYYIMLKQKNLQAQPSLNIDPQPEENSPPPLEDKQTSVSPQPLPPELKKQESKKLDRGKSEHKKLEHNRSEHDRSEHDRSEHKKSEHKKSKHEKSEHKKSEHKKKKHHHHHKGKKHQTETETEPET